ncbi:unnamed protein product, partial [Brenthis ino]
MDEGLKITNEKRHRSSSSLAGILDGVRSERKLDLKDSIPEVDDQFTIAEARCKDLQQKINLVKTLRRKKKLKKRSMTTITEPSSTSENVPLITVRTQPKKTLLVTEVSQQSSRLRRLEIPANTHPRGYIDPDLIEQHQMLDRVHAYRQEQLPKMNKASFNRKIMLSATKAKCQDNEPEQTTRSHLRRGRAAGDTMYGQGVQIDIQNLAHEVACGDDEHSDDAFDRHNDKYPEKIGNNTKRYYDSRPQSKQKGRHVPKELSSQTVPTQQWVENAQERRHDTPSDNRRHESSNKRRNNLGSYVKEMDDRPVVELFNKSRHSAEPLQRRLNVNITGHMKDHKGGDSPVHEEEATGPLEDITSNKPKKQKGRRKYHSRRYEMPTVSSQMKQAGFRYYYGNTNRTNIPFIVSKSTAPSHNIGVNIQQVLNGLKVQQPLSGIPLTIAHHMGLRHVPTHGTKSATIEPMLHNNEINVIKLGRKMLRLPSYKYMSYNRLLMLYREGDGVVPRFLRAISRPNYFYTSMYNLATNREDFDAATSKGQVERQAAKQTLVEYANLYREYQRVDKSLNENYNPELEARKDDLARQMTARESFIRKVVQEYQPEDEDLLTLRASASTGQEAYRNSNFSLQPDNVK